MSKISFHEATIRDIDTISRVITIVVDEAIVESKKCSVRIELRDVTGIVRDGAVIDLLRMEKEDGEILSLSTTSTGVELIVEWNNFSPLVTETRTYQVQCREFFAMPYS